MSSSRDLSFQASSEAPRTDSRRSSTWKESVDELIKHPKSLLAARLKLAFSQKERKTLRQKRPSS